MFVSERPTHARPALAASQGIPGAPVQIVVNVGLVSMGLRGKVFFRWQSSTDGGKTWVEHTPTIRGRTEIAGLPELTSCAFRVCVTGAKEATGWSDPVTLLVQ